RSKNPLARAMFKNLAKDEAEHKTRIQGLHERLIRDGSWPQDMPLEVAGTDIKKTLEKMLHTKGADQAHDHDDVRAIEKAIDFEAKGERFYVELAKVCQNPMERRFFEFLARLEREHHLSLTESLAYLQDPAGWMLQHEKAGLDGA
ncbi:MAG TPA: ferritin family protein, partial [Myxococcota bacterium]|nr:ferritin family protein [Myxococcota bacterium]